LNFQVNYVIIFTHVLEVGVKYLPIVSDAEKSFNVYANQPWFVVCAAKKFSMMASDDSSISHFYSFEVDPSKSLTLAIPDGCIDIFFDCDATNPSAAVYGSLLEVNSVNLSKGHLYVGVRFASGLVPDFLNVSANELVNHNFNFLDIVPNAEKFLEQMACNDNSTTKMALIKQFLRRKTTPRVSSQLTMPIINKICQEKGNVRVKDLEALTGFTTRTLQRAFLGDVGMSPKVFSRIVRCQSAAYRIKHDKISLSDLAFELGFSDQSHFLREFKRLVNATPLEYQKFVREESYFNKIRLY
jgi:AraC-like DNA-binding protein